MIVSRYETLDGADRKRGQGAKRKQRVMEQYSQYYPYLFMLVLVIGWFFIRMKRSRRNLSIKNQRRSWREGFRDRRENRLSQATSWNERRELKKQNYPADSIAARHQAEAKAKWSGRSFFPNRKEKTDADNRSMK